MDEDDFPPSLVKRMTISDTVDEMLENEDDEYISRLMKEIQEKSINAKGFRWASPHTQRDQDFVHSQYEAFLIYFRKLPPDLPDAERDRIMFPADHQLLFKQLREFMIFVSEHGKGARGKQLSYPRICQYRRHLQFWTARIYDQNRIKRVDRVTLYNKITEAMQYAAREFGFVIGGEINSRAEIGLPELRQLIDYDLATTPCIELAESHQLAWLLMRVCCLRPGSIGWTNKHRLESGLYLKWRDIKITRDSDSEFKFTAHIKFRSLKTNSDNPEQAWRKVIMDRVLLCNVRSPENTNALYFSIAHRLLVIALRRKLLKGIETMDQLIECKKKHITVSISN